MKAGTDVPQVWPGRSWILLTLLALVAQLAVVSWLSESRSALRPHASPPVQTRFLSRERSAERTRDAQRHEDPMIFALVTGPGFSGSAWLRTPDIGYDMTSPLPPWECLGVPVDDLTADFAEFVQTNVLTEDVALDNIPPARAELGLPEPVVVPAPVLRIDGSLSARTMLPGRRLPQPRAIVLTNTVVQVLVDTAGFTVSAALLASSGATQLDQDALAFAASARYTPAPAVKEPLTTSDGGMAFGTLTFRWASVEWIAPVAAASQQRASRE